MKNPIKIAIGIAIIIFAIVIALSLNKCSKEQKEVGKLKEIVKVTNTIDSAAQKQAKIYNDSSIYYAEKSKKLLAKSDSIRRDSTVFNKYKDSLESGIKSRIERDIEREDRKTVPRGAS